nr:MAG TPA: hypothetical protein [Caudoviricetes sp.]
MPPFSRLLRWLNSTTIQAPAHSLHILFCPLPRFVLFYSLNALG